MPASRPRATVCLNMIVRDEAHVIRRCLDSVRPLIDAWCILDTGSADGTQDIIREHLRDLPGALFEAPWKGFAASRNEAMEYARGRADYLLFIDADDELVLPRKFRLPELQADAYYLEHRQGETAFQRLDLVACRHPWRYVGVLHEFLESDQHRPAMFLQGPYVQERREGARSQDPRKYERDAEVLEQGLRDEPENARYVFYLAQSYRDAGHPGKALEAYRRRAGMGGWEEEVYVSLLNVANLGRDLGWPDEAVVHAYLQAYQARPRRAETLEALARFFRMKEQWNLALLFAEKGLAIRRPADLLFVDEACYGWRLLDEFAVAASWVGRNREAVQAFDRLLNEGRLPLDQIRRIKTNRDLAARQVLGR